MKILVLSKPEHTNMAVITNHFAASKIDVIKWDVRIKSAFDAFIEAKPDVLYYHSSFRSIITKASKQFPQVKLLCEDNESKNIAIDDFAYTTIVNSSDVERPHIEIGCDLISLISKRNKQIYSTDVCCNLHLHNNQNQKQMQEFITPITDIRINPKIKLYGYKQSGEYACGILDNLDEFSAYEQSKVCIALRNYVDEVNYEIPVTFWNMLASNPNVLHNYPTFKGKAGTYVEDVAALMDNIQKAVASNSQASKTVVPNAFIACHQILTNLNYKEEADNMLNLAASLKEQYKI